MSMAVKLRRAPGRIAAGAFILNSGLSKLKADDETAKQLHGMAVNSYPFLGKLDAKTFTKALSVSEIALGGALLLPIVPAALAGAGLAAFSGGLLGLYWRTPALHGENDPRPTEEGLAFAKDSWMAGIALTLLLDSLLPDVERRRALRRAERRARKAETKLAHLQEDDGPSRVQQIAHAPQVQQAQAQAKHAQEAARSAVSAAAHHAGETLHSVTSH